MEYTRLSKFLSVDFVDVGFLGAKKKKTFALKHKSYGLPKSSRGSLCRHLIFTGNLLAASLVTSPCLQAKKTFFPVGCFEPIIRPPGPEVSFLSSLARIYPERSRWTMPRAFYPLPIYGKIHTDLIISAPTVANGQYY